MSSAPMEDHVDLRPRPDDSFAAMQFVWREAELLDRLDYKAWLTLWAQDGMYVIPTEPDAPDYGAVLNIAYDDAEMRQARVKRLQSGFSMSSAPPARTVRTMSRFVFSPVGEDVIEVRSAMILAEYKYERMRVIAANVEHRLWRDAQGDFRIVRKVVSLVNADDHLHGVGYLF